MYRELNIGVDQGNRQRRWPGMPARLDTQSQQVFLLTFDHPFMGDILPITPVAGRPWANDWLQWTGLHHINMLLKLSIKEAIQYESRDQYSPVA